MAVATANKPDAGTPDRKHNIEAMRQDYYARIAQHGMTPLWKVMGALFRDEPVSRCAPAVWHFDDVKSLVMESGGLITAEEAKRRVLILENPALRGELRVTNTLFAGIQMIMPGEIAPAHRHVSSAIRFVLDGEGAYTAVEGEKAFMSPGDFVITANWAPHDHGNPSDKPMLWLDVLDAPGDQFLRDLVRRGFRQPDAGDHAAERRLAELLRLRRAARRHRGEQAHADHQLYLRPHAADHRAHDGGRRHRQEPWRARALRQSEHRRPGAADHGRQSGDAAEGLPRRALPLDRQHRLRLRRGAGHDDRRRPGAGMGAARRLRRAVVEALRPHGRRTVGAVLDFRPAGAGSARHLAGREIAALRRHPRA